MHAKIILKKRVSVFEAPIKNTTRKKDMELHEVFLLIKSDSYKYQTNRLRKINDKDKNSKYKSSKFDYATWSGIFSKREDAGLIKHSDLIVVDLDHIPTRKFQGIRDKLCTAEKNMENMVMCFTSPNGDGLKLVYLIDHKTHLQEECYRGLCNFLYKEFKIPIECLDPSCIDLSRACFLPYDPEIFLNPKLLGKINGEIIAFDPSPYLSTKKKTVSIVESESNDYYLGKIDKVLSRAKEIGKKFEPNERNSFILYVASQLNRYGIPYEFAFSALHKKIGLGDHDDHIKTMKYVYEKQKGDFGKYKNTSEKDKKRDEHPPYETPYIDDFVIKSSPQILKNVADCFPIKRERDVAYISFMGMGSGALPNVICIHRNEDFAPNLIVVVRAGFAGGKGVAANVREIGQLLHQYLKEKATELKAQYEEDLEEYERKKKDGEITDEKPPQEPYYPVFFIPVDSSSARFKEMLAKCGGQAVMFDSEVDTLNSVLSNDWGGTGYSSLLRKTAMNETIDYARKGGDDEINKPVLGVVITGTPSAVAQLIPNSEDGLFSRISFYTYEVDPEFDPETFDYKRWKKKEDLFYRLGQDFMEMYKKLEELGSRGNRIVFYWEEKYQKILYGAFSKWMQQHKAIVGKNGSKILFRLALMATRIATIFTVLRMFERGKKMMPQDLKNMSIRDKDIRVTCSEEDFYNTLHLVDIIRQHTFSVYENLPKEGKQEPIKTVKAVTLKFYNLLPTKFKREEALKDIAPLVKIKDRTVDKYLEKLVKAKLLERLEGNEGRYMKIEKYK